MLKKLLRSKSELLKGARMYRPTRDTDSLEMCRKCYSFRYDNAWHFERPNFISEKEPDEGISVKFSQCPACIEESLAMFDVEYV